MEALFIALLIAFPLAGVVLRRWTAVALPAIGWPLFYLGLDQDWWGNGLGDGWQDVAAWALVAGLVSTALAVGLARRTASAGRSRAAGSSQP
jgi:uncharacterized membrane protein